MKIKQDKFFGEIPRVGTSKLPEGYGQTATNTRLLSGDLEAWRDYAAPTIFTTTIPKSASGSVNSIHLMDDTYWLHWLSSECKTLAHAKQVDVAVGAIAQDEQERTCFTGTPDSSSVFPRVTYIKRATNSEFQGAATTGAYPYTSLKMGVPAPSSAPSVVLNDALDIYDTLEYQYAAPTIVNAVTAIAAAGTDYEVDDILTVSGGTRDQGMPAATLRVTSVDVNGGVTGVEVVTGGFYQNGSGPSSPASVTGGSGNDDATFTLTNTNASSFGAFQNDHRDNSDESYVHWDVSSGQWHVAIGQGNTGVAWSSQVLPVETCNRYIIQSDNKNLSGDDAPASDLILWLNGTYTATGGMQGPALVMSSVDGTFSLIDQPSHTNGSTLGGTVIAQTTGLTLTAGTNYRMYATLVATESSSTNGFNCTATLKSVTGNDPAGTETLVATVSGFVPFSGGTIAVGAHERGAVDEGSDSYFKNLRVQIQTDADSEGIISTSYVQTFINELGEESAPSDPSETIDVRAEDPDVTITPSVSPTSGHGIRGYRIYRAVTSATGSEFQLVTTASNIGTSQFITITGDEGGTNTTHVFGPFTGEKLSTTTYVDHKTDDELEDVLESEGWLPPPSDGHNTVTTSNGVTAMISKNQVCMSVPFRPHAYPEANKLACDYKAIALGVIDTNIVVATESNPYIIKADDPSRATMSKLELAQGCVSRRGCAYLRGVGWLYPSADGLVAVNAVGQCEIVTLPFVTPKEWANYSPSTIIGVAHDDRYFGFYNSSAGFIFDPREGGMGFVELDFYAQAVFVDKLNDKLYIVVSNILYEWNKATASLRPYVWKSRDYLLPYPAVFQIAQVRAADYNSLELRLYANGAEYARKTISSSTEFRIPPPLDAAVATPSTLTDNRNQAQDTFTFELRGTSRVQSAEFGETIEDLLGE